MSRTREIRLIVTREEVLTLGAIATNALTQEAMDDFWPRADDAHDDGSRNLEFTVLRRVLDVSAETLKSFDDEPERD